ncbi:MAG: Na+/H+ antiporter subunit E, partial [Christensenellales bacterium]
VKATFGTLKFIMTPGDTIEPRLVYFKNPDIKSDVGKATLANSITMTPGTITCDIDDDVFIVHALDVSMSEGMDESTFVEQIKKMEEKL